MNESLGLNTIVERYYSIVMFLYFPTLATQPFALSSSRLRHFPNLETRAGEQDRIFEPFYRCLSKNIDGGAVMRFLCFCELACRAKLLAPS